MTDHSGLRRVPNIDPDPRSGGAYQPGWLRDAERMEIFDRRDLLAAYDREDIRWLDKHWEMAKTPPRPPSWWRKIVADDSVLWPIAVVLLAVACIVGPALLVIISGGGW